MYAVKLKTNYLTEPVGIDPGKVHFSWVPACGLKQTAFRIVLSNEKQILSDSGKILSAKTDYIPKLLIPSRSRIQWSITLWDEHDIEGEECTSFFETGIAKEDWKASWIDPEPADFTAPISVTEPLNRASYLRKQFTVQKGSRSRLYITAHGIYDAWINGHHIDGYFLAPGTSQYPKRLQVQTYDIQEFLNDGSNEILVSLGEGWWRGSNGWWMNRNFYGDRLALLCQVEVDGCAVAVSDTTWEASQNGPLGLNDTMRLEQYDAQKEISDWHSVICENFGVENLIGTSLPVTAHERFAAKLITTPNGERILDFGQNFAGYVELDVAANGGEKILLTHGEALDPDGNFQNRNFQNREVPYCEQKLEYTCKKGRNIYHQTKCYYGFRYAKVETDLVITGSEFTGVAVYSDMEQTGFFKCGNPEVNQLFQNSIWSMKSNFVDVPTDCPHREKSGFTGDCQAFSGTAFYLMDCYPVLARWLLEQAATQFDNGCVKQMAPDLGPHGFDGSAGWCDSLEVVPYRIMKLFDSVELLKELYPYIKKWMQFCIDRAKPFRPENASMPEVYRDYFVDCGHHWGEWCEPGRTPQDYFKESDETGHAEIATAYLSYGCLLTSEMAKRLGKTEDAEFFRDVCEKAKNAYRYAYIKDGRITSDRQCHYVRPLFMDLLSEEEKLQAAEDLVSLIQANGGMIGTGFLTTYELCNVLADNGHAKTAFDLLLNTECPSWLYEVRQGATTIWESWFGIREGEVPRGSLNHYSFGAISGWLMSRAAGIIVADSEITIKPHTDKRLGYVECTYLSPLGKISSNWRYADGKVYFEVEIPANQTAKVILPNGERHEVETGTYSFVTKEE